MQLHDTKIDAEPLRNSRLCLDAETERRVGERVGWRRTRNIEHGIKTHPITEIELALQRIGEGNATAAAGASSKRQIERLHFCGLDAEVKIDEVARGAVCNVNERGIVQQSGDRGLQMVCKV